MAVVTAEWIEDSGSSIPADHVEQLRRTCEREGKFMYNEALLM